MKDFNIKDLEINFEISSILSFLESKKAFEIDIYGNIYAVHEAKKSVPLIFRGQMNNSETQLHSILNTLFGNEYKVRTTPSHCKLIPLGAWQNVISLNQDRMTYFDHQTDGIEVFEEKVLEDIGWQAVSLNITYRELCDYLEKHCQGTFVYYDNGMHFNGFVILEDIQDAQVKMHEYVYLRIQEKINQEELVLDDLEDDEKEALTFFKYKG